MADFPTSPTIGDVYDVGGLSALCVGTNRFKFLPEFTTFPTVAAMKTGIVPANHRAACVRYTAGGKIVEGLTYYSRGLGWPVVADGYVNHLDSKGNFLELQLENNTISLDHTGADSTGTADAAPHLRAAMARLGQNNGGTLLIPVGTFYLNSGDPRGLKIAGTPDFYTVCEIVSNVTVKGYGDGSVLLYNSNRIGTVPALGYGDSGVIFANFRVRSPSNTPYACTNFNVENFKVIYTTLTNQTVDSIDGQVVRVYSLLGSVTNGAFYANNINVSGATGHQVFSYEKVDLFTSTGCRFYSSGKATNLANTDVSLYYVTGTEAIIEGNYSTGSTAATDNSTFIELHTVSSVVTGNTCFGMHTFMNAVSQVTHPSSFYDFSEFRVSGNHARDVRNFVIDWVAAANRKSLLLIKGNTVVLRATASTDVETFLRHAAITGSSDLPTENVILEGNITTVSVSGSGAAQVAYGTSFDGLIRHQFAKRLSLVDNEFRNCRRNVLVIDGIKIQEVTASRNLMEFGLFANNTSDVNGKVCRSGLIVNFQINTVLSFIEVKDNNLRGIYSGSEANHGIFMLNSGGVVPTKVVIQDNQITNTKSEELGAEVFAGNSHSDNAFMIRHTASLVLSSTLASAFPAVGINAIFAGSKISYDGSDVEVTKVGSSKDFTVFGKRNAPPTTGYHSAGSWIHNTASGPLGWKCETAGTPGTWVAIT